MSGPLQGLRAIELCQLLAGPFCGQLLGDFGAEIIKIERPGEPDPFRQWGPVQREGCSAWFAVVARNKRCATLDVRTPEGLEAIKALIAGADFLIENFRPGTLEKWGLGWDVLSALNPRLILVRVSGYGQTGPYAHRAGYASVGEAMGGLRYVMGEPDRPPSRAGISIGDTLAGAFAALGALAALEARRTTGRGQVVDSAIYEACLAVMESLIPDYALGGHVRERSGSVLPKIAPSNIYPARDGLLVIAANQDSVFARLCEAMGEPALATDPAFADHRARGERQAELDARIAAWSSSRACAELEALLDRHGVPFGRLYRAPDMLSDPHFAAREAIVTLPHPVFGALPMQNVFPKLSHTPGVVRWPAREPGADNDYVFGELLGYPPERRARLAAQGVI